MAKNKTTPAPAKSPDQPSDRAEKLKNDQPATASVAKAEHLRLAEDETREKNWKRWGPYLAERQWGTVREDYSPEGESWGYFTHEHARSRAYRWGEDGLLGITDRECRLCFALALWNGKDPFLKERLYGLTNGEGNHGEDVKEAYFYLDSSPTHSYLKALYKYPQAAFPYDDLLAVNRARTRAESEYELADTGIFKDGRYFDVQAEYAKAAPDDILIRITITNRGPDAAELHVLPTLWFRNVWTWGCTHEGCAVKPLMKAVQSAGASGGGNTESSNVRRVAIDHETLGKFTFHSEGDAPLLFTENESNAEKLFDSENASPYVKDAFHACVVEGKSDAVNPKLKGTKCAPHHQFTLAAGEARVLRLRLKPSAEPTREKDSSSADAAAVDDVFDADFDAVFTARIQETDAFYDERFEGVSDVEQRRVARQANAGLLWTKQFYHYVIKDWIDGDPATPAPPKQRKKGRNSDWGHLFSRDVLSMPDKWEYPWFAAWDLAFHMLPFAKLDARFAKHQLNLLLREWYMNPNGQLPAYEYDFSDVNPPVHAWACWRVYKLTGPRGKRDRKFLASVFQKLLLNFTWWVNRKDPTGKNLFAGGFLGLDNIGVFDRSKPLPGGATLTQADGTAWMAFYCSTMLAMALELAEEDQTYEDIASKFFEHFLFIADAINRIGGEGLWHEEDGFYYDQLLKPDGTAEPLRLRSVVGIVPLFAVEFIEQDRLDTLPGFAKRTRWFLKNRPDLAQPISMLTKDGCTSERLLLAIPTRERLERVLKVVLDEKELLSSFGVRSLSKAYSENPYEMEFEGETHRVAYAPGDSDSWSFGGNSNWRGPVWFPLNYLLIEALERYDHFYGDTFKIDFPTGSGNQLTLKQVADELSQRMVKLFLPDKDGHRPAMGGDPAFAQDPNWKDLVLFHEFFNGDTGKGLGASHQTGWTALVTRFIEQCPVAGPGKA